MLPRAVTDSHHKKRTSQNVAALGGGGVIEGDKIAQEERRIYQSAKQSVTLSLSWFESISDENKGA